MPICITCSTPVKELYTVYSKADDRTLGKGVRLTQCPNCKRFADKYVEHDFVVLFIDLVLIKPQVGPVNLCMSMVLTKARSIDISYSTGLAAQTTNSTQAFCVSGYYSSCSTSTSPGRASRSQTQSMVAGLMIHILVKCQFWHSIFSS